MSKTDSITLWRNRIQSRKLSGLKVNDWCEQNSISRDSYYYWHSKLNNNKKEQDDTFAEVLLEPAPLTPLGKFIETKISIAWKDFSISVTDQNSIPMVAELLCRIEKQC